MPNPTKPTLLPRFAETAAGTAASNISQPSSGQQDTGWLNKQVPPSGVMNWLLWVVYKWLAWLNFIVLRARGPFDNAVNYQKNDIVTSGGGAWLALQDVAAGGGAPSAGANWQVLAAAGGVSLGTDPQLDNSAGLIASPTTFVYDGSMGHQAIDPTLDIACLISSASPHTYTLADYPYGATRSKKMRVYLHGLSSGTADVTPDHLIGGTHFTLAAQGRDFTDLFWAQGGSSWEPAGSTVAML